MSDDRYREADCYAKHLRGDVETIRTLLQEKYSRGFPVLKELLQNSDDAQSETLVLGWSPGLGPGQANPLLEGPAIIVVNDGRFRASDASNMRNFNSSMQAANGRTIGSFGLGLKSLYHLAEAVLYFSSDYGHGEWPVGTEDRRHGALSVWFHPERQVAERPGWHLVQDSVGLVNDHIAPLTANLKRWFCLWIPLRRDSHVINKIALSDVPAGHRNPGEIVDGPASGLIPDDAAEQFASILPMLAELRNIEHRVRDANGVWRDQWHVRVNDGSDTVKSRGSNVPVPSQPLQGRVTIRRWNWDYGKPDAITVRQSTMVYSGREVSPGDPKLTELMGDNRWPRSVRLPEDQDTLAGSATDRAAHAPHAAVYWAVLLDDVAEGMPGAAEPRPRHRDSSHGTLSYAYASYLPLGDPLAVDITHPLRIWLVRHARFFVDSGRREPILPDRRIGVDTDIRGEWNDSLRVFGIEPLVLPTLAAFVLPEEPAPHHHALSHDSITALTEAISQTAFFLNHRDDVCARFRWLSTLDHSSRDWSWRAVEVSASRPIVTIPRPSSPELALSVFPDLGSIASGDAFVVQDDRVRLTHTLDEKTASCWKAEWIARLLDGVAVDAVMPDRARRNYLAQFIGHVRERVVTSDHERLEAHAAISRLVRRVLASEHVLPLLTQNTDNRSHSELHDLVRDLVSLVLPDHRWSVAITGAPAQAVLGSISKGVMVPVVLEPADKKAASTGRPDIDDVTDALRALAEVPEYERVPGNPEARILDKLERDDRADVLRRLGTLPVIRVELPVDLTGTRPRIVSWRTLERLHRAGRLVTETEDVTQGERYHLWQLLGTGDDDVRLAIISTFAARVFFPPDGPLGTPGRLNVETAFRIVHRAPMLAPSEERIEGFRWLLLKWHQRNHAMAAGNAGYSPGMPERDDWAVVLRFILHGEPAAREADDVLILCRNVDNPLSEGWGIGWTLREGLSQVGRAWQVVGDPLARLVDDHAMDGLRLERMTVNVVGRELVLRDTSSQPEAAEREPSEPGRPASERRPERWSINPADIRFEMWDSVHRDVILAECSPLYEIVPQFLSALRVHDQVGDANATQQLVAASDPDAYLSDRPCPDDDAVAKMRTVVRRSEVHEAGKLQALMLRPFNWHVWLHTALDAPDPSNYHREIIKAIEACGLHLEVGTETHTKVRDTAWLPLSAEWESGGVCCPSEVMDVGKALDSEWRDVSRLALSAGVAIQLFTPTMVALVGSSATVSVSPAISDAAAVGGLADKALLGTFLQRLDGRCVDTIASTAMSVAPDIYATALPPLPPLPPVDPRGGSPADKDVPRVTGTQLEELFRGRADDRVSFGRLLAAVDASLRDRLAEGLHGDESNYSKVSAILGVLEEIRSNGGVVNVDAHNGGAVSVEAFVNVQGAYLRQACVTGDPRTVMAGAILHDAANGWNPAGVLCHSGNHPLVIETQRAHNGYDLWLNDLFIDPVPDGSVIGRNGSGRALAVPATGPGSSTAPPQEVSAAAPVLRAYFRPWIERGAGSSLIGAFVMLLGHEPGVVGLATEYLGARGEPRSLLRSLWPGRWSEEAGARQFVVTVSDGSTTETRSLADTPLMVSHMTADGSQSRDGGFAAIVRKVGSHASLTLIPPTSTMPVPRFLDCLFDTAIHVINQSQGSYIIRDKFTVEWKRLREVNGLGVKVDDAVITALLQTYLERIGVERTGILADELGAVDRASDRWNEERALQQLRTRPGQSSVQSDQEKYLRARLDQSAQALRNKIESNPAAQDAVLAAVRRFLDQTGYRTGAMLSELLQNADDALGQTISIEDAGQPDASFAQRTVVRITWNDEGLSFCHWGRLVNRSPVGGKPGRGQSDSEAFNRDVTRMLTFGGSRKPLGEAETTGQFGMGFKTVFIASRSPRLISGELAFEVRGGVIPVELSSAERTGLRAALEDAGSDHLPAAEGTHLRLPWRVDGRFGQERVRLVQSIVSRFEATAEYQLLFARHIKTLQVGQVRQVRKIQWSREPLPAWMRELSEDAPAPGRTSPATMPAKPMKMTNEVVSGGVGGTTRRFLRFFAGNASLALMVGDSGFVSLGPEVPSIWATTPIDTGKGLGFLLDARFELETGRTRFRPNSEQNRSECQSLGEAVASAIRTIYLSSDNNFQELVTSLGMARAVNRSMFFGTLFDVLSASLSSQVTSSAVQVGGLTDEVSIARSALWGSPSIGFSSVLADRSLKVVPSMIPAPFDECVCLPDVRWYTDGALDNDEAMLSFLGLPETLACIGVGSVVSGAQVFRRLKVLCPDLVTSMRPLRVATIVGLIAPPGEPISPDLAARLWDCVAGFIGTGHAEESEIKGALVPIRFQSEDPDSPDASADDLRSRTGSFDVISPDEQKFTPVLHPRQILGPDYSDDAIRLFAACRSRPPDMLMEAPEAIARATGQRLAAVPEAMEQLRFIPKLTPLQAESTRRNVASLPEREQKLAEHSNLFQASISAASAGVRVVPEGDQRPAYVQAILTGLERKGWAVKSEYGVLGYQMDLAVIDQADQSVIAGIECDGYTFHSDDWKMLEDQSREVEIIGNGVRMIHRVWDLRWRANPAFELERLHRLLLADVARVLQERNG